MPSAVPVSRSSFVGMIVSIGLMVAACGQLPKPFQSLPGSGAAELIARDNGGGVRVQMLDGPPAPMAKLLAKSVAEDLVRRGIPATADEANSLKYTLKGRVDALESPTAAGKVARIHWSLLLGESEPFFTFSQDVEGSGFDWRWGSPQIIAKVGADAGRLVAEAVEPEDETLKAVIPVSAGVWVKPIRDSPGDGDKSLTRAMRFALMRAKVAVTSEKMAARHILDGHIRVTPPSNGRQKVEIRWRVTYPDGGIVGHAVQRNEVPAGTFDGRWGETAAVIAAAAVGGVKDVLTRAEETVRFRLAADRRLKTDVVKNGIRPVLPPPELSPEPKLPAQPALPKWAPKS